VIAKYIYGMPTLITNLMSAFPYIYINFTSVCQYKIYSNKRNIIITTLAVDMKNKKNIL